MCIFSQYNLLYVNEHSIQTITWTNTSIRGWNSNIYKMQKSVLIYQQAYLKGNIVHMWQVQKLIRHNTFFGSFRIISYFVMTEWKRKTNHHSPYCKLCYLNVHPARQVYDKYCRVNCTSVLQQLENCTKVKVTGPPIYLLMDKVQQGRQQWGDEHRASPLIWGQPAKASWADSN